MIFTIIIIYHIKCSKSRDGKHAIIIELNFPGRCFLLGKTLALELYLKILLLSKHLRCFVANQDISKSMRLVCYFLSENLSGAVFFGTLSLWLKGNRAHTMSTCMTLNVEKQAKNVFVEDFHRWTIASIVSPWKIERQWARQLESNAARSDHSLLMTLCCQEHSWAYMSIWGIH